MRVVCITDRMKTDFGISIGDEFTVSRMHPPGFAFVNRIDGGILRLRVTSYEFVEYPDHIFLASEFVPIDEVPGEVEEVEEEIFT